MQKMERGIKKKNSWEISQTDERYASIDTESINPKRTEKNIDRSKCIIVNPHNVKDKGTRLKMATEKR